jgi:hypothetical protein
MKLNRQARLGFLFGAVFSLIGTAAGFYVGLLKPALDRGESLLDLPPGLLLLSAAFLLGAAVVLFKLLRPEPAPRAEEW